MALILAVIILDIIFKAIEVKKNLFTVAQCNLSDKLRIQTTRSGVRKDNVKSTSTSKTQIYSLCSSGYDLDHLPITI